MQETRSEAARNRRVGGSLEERFQASTPTTKYQYVDVHFEEAGIDTAVEHLLLPAFPNNVNYEVVQASAPVAIYHDTSSTRRQWVPGVILLRSNVANVRVRLKLSLPAEETIQEGVTSPGPAGQTITPAGLLVSGDITATGNLTIQDLDVNGNLNVDGAAQIDGALNVDGAVDFDSTLDVAGVHTQRSQIDLIGGQIKFPATQAASSDVNTLDDYEEGTWTPSLKFGGATTGITYTSRQGSYTKIGRLVFVALTMTLSSKGSATGVATIGGLPFTSSSLVEQTLGVPVGTLIGLTAPVAWTVGSTDINLNQSDTAGVNDTHFTNSTFLFVSGVYFV